MKDLKRILQAMGLAALVSILLIQIFPVNVALATFGIKPMIVATDSMQGVLEVGDMVILMRQTAAELNVGDIISFNADINGDGKPEIVTHFLAAKTTINYQLQLRTKSNVSEQLDPWTVGANAVYGRIILRIPAVGRIIQFLQQTKALLIAAVVLVLVWAGSLIRKRVKS